MYRIWFERGLPAMYASLLDGVAIAVGPDRLTPDPALIAAAGTQGVIASSRVRYDGAFFDRVPTVCVVSRTGIGYDNISVADATERGVAICVTPDAPTISTAEFAITLMLAVLRHLKPSENMLRGEERRDFFTEYNGLESYGLTLGLIGVGRIGSRVAKIANALGMRVLAYDPYISPERAQELDIELVPTLNAALNAADVVTLHVPLMPETHHIINAASLAQMKRGAYLINTARGGLVDERALIEALDSGHLKGAGLDVFDPEPPASDNPLLHRENVIATPHIAGASMQSKDRLWQQAIAQALQVLRGERPPNLLNPECWARLQERRARVLGDGNRQTETTPASDARG
ncbi:MAG TPA: hydroxyacid dehydrogenase [Anaerolineae bacterium]|nr:hydroxyacid dehydrogenase [Anaerolineae bacterium]